MKKIYVVGPSTHYARWIVNMPNTQFEMTNNIREADVVMFTGGEDINPEIYECEPHPTTYFNNDRDSREINVYNACKKNQLMLGICRGAQLLTALNGGILVQDVNHHAIGYTHEMNNGEYSYEITSLHHQMMYPWELEPDYYEVLYKTEYRSDYYEGDGVDADICRQFGDPEVVFYHTPGNPRALCIQGHPEMMSLNSPTVVMLYNLVLKLVDNA